MSGLRGQGVGDPSIDPPRIVRTAAQLTAFIHLSVPRAQIGAVMGPGIAEVRAAIAAQGIAAAGPWFTHHLRMDPDVFDIEICVPVATPVAATGRVRPGRLPAATVAHTVFRGRYEGLGAAWGAFAAWIAAAGHTAGPDLWECYLAGPQTDPDPSTWRTELNRPLIALAGAETTAQPEPHSEHGAAA